MLYAEVGQDMPSDPYALEGVAEEHRRLIKITLMKMINAPGRRISRPKKMPLPTGWTWKQFQDAIEATHAPIRQYLRSGAGVLLQRKDSDIAETVMLAMQARGILVLFSEQP
jgi:alpha-D-ribose 1-methylphosphonate 5-phosphate C-P lyase